MPTTRYAPSPTGNMHLGNARTALLAWLQARAIGSTHILRFEDLDRSRVRPFAFESIQRDLEWLGLHWDLEYVQSQRLEHYAAALSRLKTYPCTCSKREIERVASAPHGHEPLYPQTCLKHGARANVPAALRWRVPQKTLGFADHLLGRLEQNLTLEVGDFVLRRSDGVYAYHLAVVVDDALMNVTHVLRGADLFSSTPRQIALQKALEYPTPEYWHVGLMTDYRGERLAKRNGAPSVTNLRESGYSSGALLADLVRSLGWLNVTELELSELLERFRAGEFTLEGLG